MTSNKRSYARIGWLAATLALGVGLVAGAWMNRRAAASAAALLNTGQAEVLEAAARAAFHPWGPEVDSAALALFVEEHAESGLRYMALISPSGEVRAGAGVAAAPPEPPVRAAPGAELPLMEMGGRVRAWFFRPPGPGERGGVGSFDARAGGAAAAALAEPPGAQLGAARDSTPAAANRRDGRRDFARGGRAGGGSGQQAYLLLEFEPVVASSVVAGATRSLGLAGVAASILTLAAVLFWRLTEKYDAARLSLVEQRRLTQLGELSAVMAHEIRNPLASLKGNAQLLAEGLAPGSRERGRAERVIGEATRLESLTSDLLDFARSAPLDLKSVDPVAPVRASLADLGEEGFELDARRAPQRWALDPERVRQLLLNVLQNARQASPEGKKPSVRVAGEGKTLIYEVRDFGPGLPSGSEARIFDPFFTTRTKGTGLGLAVARRVAEMHGGTIAARNHPEGGALFRIEIPDGRGF
jgi:two-component system sensor histidine kinase HydH